MAINLEFVGKVPIKGRVVGVLPRRGSRPHHRQVNNVGTDTGGFQKCPARGHEWVVEGSKGQAPGENHGRPRRTSTFAPSASNKSRYRTQKSRPTFAFQRDNVFTPGSMLSNWSPQRRL